MTKATVAVAIAIGVGTAVGCGASEPGYDPAAYSAPSYPSQTDPATVLQQQHDAFSALSESSRRSHEAAMNSINNMNP
jgi:hypothetical protein